jgi:hypothetical protein
MAGSWEGLCRAEDLRVEGAQIEVKFADGRGHRVAVEDDGEAYGLKAFVVRRAVVEAIPDLPVRVWIRNRATQLVGFRIDRQDRLVAEAWVPKVGVTAEEFQVYVRTVARESDRFEFVLTGRDVE